MKKIYLILLIICGSNPDILSQREDKLLVNPNSLEISQVLSLKDNKLKLTKVPSIISVKKPDSTIEYFRIYFNKDKKNQFVLSYGKCVKDNCTSLESHFKDGYAELGFFNSSLIRINDKALTPMKVDTTEIYIEVKKYEPKKETEKKSDDPYDRLKTTKNQQIVDLDDNDLPKYLNCLLCGMYFDCCTPTSKNSTTSSTICGKDSATFCSLLNKLLSKEVSLSNNTDSSTALVALYYDETTGKATWKSREKSTGPFKIVKDITKLKIRSGSDVFVQITGDINTEYSVHIDQRNYFIDSSDVAGILTNLQNAIKGLSAGNDTPTSDKKEDTETTTSFATPEKKLKAQFLALDKVLEQFNYKFNSINFRQAQYIKELALLKQAIKKCLEIPVPDEEKDLASILINIVVSSVGSSYWVEFSNLIKVIENEYKKANTKKPSLKIYGRTIPIPNSDEISISIFNNSKKDTLYLKDFIVKGGFKIDFSTGLVFTGLGSPKFDLYKTTFRYRETKDTIVIRSGQPVDSLVNTGRFLDTSAALIKKDSRRLNFGAGFFAHAYWRSGTNLNWGITTGIIYNSDGQLQFMLGIAPMVRVGNNRISIVIGGVAGKTSKLSSVHSENLWNDSYKEYENGGRIFASSRVLPKFFESENSSDIKVNEHLGISYFFGLAFNFASVTPGKKN